MPAPFAAFAADAFTIGSASKLCWGGLRVGWIRAPREHIERLIATRVQMDLGSSLFDQLVVAEMLDAHGALAARRAQMRERRDTLAQALREHLPDWRFRLPEGGLSLWVRMPHGSATQLADTPRRDGMAAFLGGRPMVGSGCVGQTRRNTRSHTPWPSLRPRFSNLVSGR